MIVVVNGATLSFNLVEMIFGFAGGTAGYHLWRWMMIAWFGYAAVVPHRHVFSASVAVAMATKVQ